MSNETPNSAEVPTTSDNLSEPKKQSETQSEKTFARYRSLILSECGFKITTTENHLKRLQNLRKELNFINETDWLYETSDKRIPS